MNQAELQKSLKLVALGLSDIISTQLKLVFMIDFQSINKIRYDIFLQKLDRKYLTFATKDRHSTQIIHVFDSSIIYALNNRIFGGEGLVEKREFDDLFSFSEMWFIDMFEDWVLRAYKKQGFDFYVSKSVENPKFYHLFLPDDEVIEMVFEVKITKTQIGLYYICMPLSFIDDADLSTLSNDLSIKPDIKKSANRNFIDNALSLIGNVAVTTTVPLTKAADSSQTHELPKTKKSKRGKSNE